MVEENQAAPVAETPLAPAQDKTPIDFLNDLRAEREKMEKLRDEIKKLNSEQIVLQTRMEMGGQSLAGKPQVKEKTIEDIAQEQADAVIKKYWKR